MRAHTLPTFGQFLLMMAIALTGCAAPQTASPTLLPPTPTSAPLMATRQMPAVPPVLLYAEWPSDGFPNDPAQMSITDLENNILTIKVVYSGGCRRDHTFELHAFTAFLLSGIPQGVLHLSHDAHGDICTAQIAEFLKFDLTPLNKERNDPSEHPLLLNLYEPIGGDLRQSRLGPRLSGHKLTLSLSEMKA